MIPSGRAAKELKELCGMQEYVSDVQVMKESDLMGKNWTIRSLQGDKLDG